MEYVQWLDRKMLGTKFLLVTDNCPAHTKTIEGLQNIELFYLPPNMASKIQSCDAGIIRAFKDALSSPTLLIFDCLFLKRDY